MSKWDKHKSRFKELNESDGLSIREYCEANDLNYNTARRYLRLDDQSVDQVTDQSNKAKSDKSGESKNKRVKNNYKKQQIKKKEAPKRELTHQRVVDRKLRDTENGRSFDHSVGGRNKKGQFATGNMINYRHGLFASPKYEDMEEAVRLLMDSGNPDLVESNALKSLISQQVMMERIQSDALEFLNNLSENKPLNESGEEEEEPPAVFKMLKILNDTGFSLSMITKEISAIVEKSYTRDFKERQLSLKEREAMVCAEAFDMKKSGQITALEAVEFIESQGVKAPVLLMKQAEQELEDKKRDASNQAVISDSELDEKARAYRQKIDDERMTIAERRKLLDEMMDKGGYKNSEDLAIKPPPAPKDVDTSKFDVDIVKDLYGDS